MEQAARHVGQVWGLTEDPERAIIDRIAAGDHHALTELYGRYQRPLFAYVRVFIRDPDLAEETLQDTFVAVWTSAHGFRGQSSARGWLYAVARRQALKAIRGAAAASVETSLDDAMPSSDPPPDMAAVAAEFRDDLVAALGRLSPTLREVVILTLVDGFSYQEVARIVGIPIGTVRSRLNTARRALRPLLEAGRTAW